MLLVVVMVVKWWWAQVGGWALMHVRDQWSGGGSGLMLGSGPGAWALSGCQPSPAALFHVHAKLCMLCPAAAACA